MTAILEKYNSRIYFILLALIGVLLPTVEVLDVKALSFVSILLAVWYLLSGNWKSKWNEIKHNKLIWLFCSLYVASVYGLLLSDNLEYATDMLVRKLPILLFPFIIATSPRLSKNQVSYLSAAFAAGLFILSLYTFREGLAPLLNRNDLTELVRLVPMHRPYLGMFSAFAVLVLLYLAKTYSHWAIRAVTLALALYFVFYIYVIFAKMSVVALGVLALVILLIYTARRLPIYFSILGAVLLLSGAIIFFKTNKEAATVFHKITSFEDFSYQEYNVHLVSSINIRYINWGCSFSILKQDHNWLTGLGLGNVQEQLLQCYKERNPWIYEQQHNAHNEYLEEILRNGIIGLVILIACFTVPIGLSIYHQRYLYLSFLLLFALSCLTESMLSRQAGVMFYAFFNSIYAFHLVKSPSKQPKIATH